MAEAMNTGVYDDLDNKYLTFNIGEDIHGIELAKVTEIIGVQHITYVPDLPEYIVGLINLRGKIVPAIDARLRMGYEKREYDDKTCTVIVDYENEHIGLLVDCVEEVLAAEPDEIAAPPKSANKDKNRFLKQVIHRGGKVVTVVDCEKLFANREDEEEQEPQE